MKAQNEAQRTPLNTPSASTLNKPSYDYETTKITPIAKHPPPAPTPSESSAGPSLPSKPHDNDVHIPLDEKLNKQLSLPEKRMANKAAEQGLERLRQSKELKEAAAIPQQVAGSTYIDGMQQVPDDVSAKCAALIETIDVHASNPQYEHPTLWAEPAAGRSPWTKTNFATF